ncbi:hypothetical protein AB0D83_37775 [Streptomyces decoyicus]|uniref:hypothetical protein n=1 Tax=Streptomyces decoyicus TaxID=249567 RepID=UPI003402EAED
MRHAEAEAALEYAQFDRRQALRHEESASDGGRGEAELAEWERIIALLAGTGEVYDPQADAVVQDEQRAEAERKETWEKAEAARRLEAERVAARSDELMRLAAAGGLDSTAPTQTGDEAVRDHLEGVDYRVPRVNSWLAQALADHTGHYADPAARTAAVGSLKVPVRARAALLAALSHTGSPAVDKQLEFVGRLAVADPAATTALAAWLDTALGADATARKGGKT